MLSHRCLEFYMQDPEHDWDLQIRKSHAKIVFGGPEDVTDNHLGLDIVQARWFHIVGVSIYFFEQLIYTMKFYMNE